MSGIESEIWSLRNFKSIGEARIPLAHLTILSGMNSSGKSSLIQSILFVSQSMSKDAIILNGPLIRLGLPEDTVRDHEPNLTVGGTLTLDKDSGGFSWSATLAVDEKGIFEVIEYSITDDEGSSLVRATSSRIPASDRSAVPAVADDAEFLLRVTEFGGVKAPPRTFLTLDGMTPREFVFRRTEEEARQSFTRLFPRNKLKTDKDTRQSLAFFLTKSGRRTAEDQTLVASQKIAEILDKPVFRGKEHAPEISEELYKAMRDEQARMVAEPGWTTLPLAMSVYFDWHNDPFLRRYLLAQSQLQDESRLEALAHIAKAVNRISSFAESVKYIGPLREQPQVVNSSYGADHPGLPVGLRGESAAHALVEGQRLQVQFRRPDGVPTTLPLAEAAAVWASYLGLGDKIAVQDSGKLGRGLRVALNEHVRDLTMVGVGASQLLPIILAALSVRPGSLLVMEQPELHLHPAVQSRLADFLLTARPDVRFIVETHSEYLITRLRRRIAEQAANPDSTRVFFAEQTEGVTAFKELAIDDLGNFDQWPSGFFDTQNEESRAIISAITARLANPKK